jgi:Tol biopolymer transport system component
MLLKADESKEVHFHAVTAIPGSDVLLLVRHRMDLKTPIEAWNGSRFVVIANFDDQYMSTPVWSPSGHVLFARGMGKFDLWAVPFSPQRMEVTGDPFLVQTDAGAPSVSAAGTLAFVRGPAGLGSEIVWVLPDGSMEVICNGGEIVFGPIVSPDGSRVAFVSGPSVKELNVWLRDLERGIDSRISSLDGMGGPVAWSPDSREIAVADFDLSAAETVMRTRFFAADGSGPTREPYKGLLASINADWTRAVQFSDPRGRSTRISAVDLKTMTEIGQVVASASPTLTSLSPDGGLLLYASQDSGEMQIYCTRFPSGEGRWQVSGDGGVVGFWSPDGSSVYYMNSKSEFIRVPLTREPTIRFGLPEKVFPTMPTIAEIGRIRPAPDGKRFIAVRARSEEDAKTGHKILLIENWFEEFREGRPK